MQDQVIPLVSVCIPVYNRKEMLRSCLLSIVRQSLVDIEIIVLDNCSEDNLLQVVEEINDPRVIYFRNNRNIGLTNNFIKVASLARGMYIKIVGSDDLLMPNCLEESLKELRSHPSADALLSKEVIVREGVSLNPSVYSLPFVGFAKNLNYLDNSEVFGFVNIGPSAWLIKKEAFWDHGGFDRSLRVMFDWELYYQMLQYGGGVVFFDRILTIRMVHQSNESLIQSVNHNYLLDILQLRRQGLPGESVVNAEIIWRQLSQFIRNGQSIIPILKLVYDYGYLTHFALMFPVLLVRHTYSRLIKFKSAKNIVPVPMEIERALHETWSVCKKN